MILNTHAFFSLFRLILSMHKPFLFSYQIDVCNFIARSLWSGEQVLVSEFFVEALDKFPSYFIQ